MAVCQPALRRPRFARPGFQPATCRGEGFSTIGMTSRQGEDATHRALFDCAILAASMGTGTAGRKAAVNIGGACMAFPTAQFECLAAALGRIAKVRDNQGGSRIVGPSAAQQLAIHVIVGRAFGIIAVGRVGWMPGCDLGVVLAVVPFFDQLTHVARLGMSQCWRGVGTETSG